MQDVTVTLDDNWDNKHIVSCCYNFLKCVVTEVVLFSVVAFKTLDIWQGSVATHLSVVGSLVIVLLHIFSHSDSEIILKIG